MKVALGFVTEPATRFEALNLTVKGRLGKKISPGRGKLMIVETMLSSEGISPITVLKCVRLNLFNLILWEHADIESDEPTPLQDS